MKAILRDGSAWKDVERQVRAITEMGQDSRHFLLCTDDSHAETVVTEGHMNRVVKQAISQGLPPMTAIQMATINTAEHFGLGRDMGMIAPGRYADILFVDNLPEMKIGKVFTRGQLVVEDGQVLIDLPPYDYPDWVKSSIHLGRKLGAKDFQIRIPDSEKPIPTQITANVIGIIENQARNRKVSMEIPVFDGEIRADMSQDIAKVALVERHKGTGDVQVGLVHGFGFDVPCAIGTTVAHDSHHMIIVGTDETNMATAAEILTNIQGGQVVVREGKVIGQVALPIAGLMSNERAEVVAQQASSVLNGFRACGCELNNPNMQLAFLALVVIPEIRISDLGLVDVTRFEFIPVIES
jgi:adenine deaminase